MAVVGVVRDCAGYEAGSCGQGGDLGNDNGLGVCCEGAGGDVGAGGRDGERERVLEDAVVGVKLELETVEGECASGDGPVERTLGALDTSSYGRAKLECLLGCTLEQDDRNGTCGCRWCPLDLESRTRSEGHTLLGRGKDVKTWSLRENSDGG